MLSHSAVIKCEYAYQTDFRKRAAEGVKEVGRMRIEGWGVLICANLGRDRISSLLLFEPAREPRVICVADSGWKPTGTAV